MYIVMAFNKGDNDAIWQHLLILSERRLEGYQEVVAR